MAVFTLASGRSGTHYLYELLHHNAADCACHHETYGGNPSMFGRPIFDFALGDRQRTRDLLLRKRCIALRCRRAAYIETSHAFLKSWFDLAPEYFPNFKLVHLIRDPLKVAKSEASREAIIKWLRVPFCHYRGGDGRRYFYWCLTGLEPIYRSLDTPPLTRFQWYLVQWIEIENRAMSLLDSPGLKNRCFTLHSPHDLSDANRISELLSFLDLKPKRRQLAFHGRKNRNWRPTVIDVEDHRQFQEVLARVPTHYLQIFLREPYASLPGDTFAALRSAAGR
jgi:hypothetical protein